MTRQLAKASIIFFSVLLAQGAGAADTTGITATSIKIGLFGPLTGGTAATHKTVLGAAAIYKDINGKGGINGRKFDLVIEDDGCDPAKGLAAVHKLLTVDRVFLLHGAFCSPVALAIKPEIIKQPTLPYMILGAGSAAISSPTVSNIFHPVVTSKTIMEQIVEFALSKPGAKRIAIVRHPDEWGTVNIQPTLARLKEHGLAPVAVALLARGDKSAEAQVRTIHDSKPDVVIAILYPEETTLYLRDAYRLGLRTTTLATTVVSLDDVDKNIGIPAATSDFYAAYSLRDKITAPELSKFAQIFKKYYPDQALDTMSLYSMGGAIAVAEAARRSGPDITRERFIAELDKLRDFETGVQSALLTFTPTDHVGIKTLKMIGFAKKPRRSALFDKYPAHSN